MSTKIPDVTPLSLRTADGERLHAVLMPGPPGTRVCAVLAHGFSGAVERPAVARVAAGLARSVAVLAYDARGHGRSTGVSTLGDREVLDVDAAVTAARECGFATVATCGWSMGGAAVVRHAALRGASVAGHPVRCAPDAVVAVSTTSRWFVRDTAPMRRLHRIVGTRAGRLVARRVMRTRVDAAGWTEVPLSPQECVARVAPLPLLLVHGDRDPYFPVEHPHALVEAADGGAELWLEPGFAHAETAATPELLDRIGARLAALEAVS